MSASESPIQTDGGSSWLRALARLWCLRRVAAAPRGSPVAAVGFLGVSWLTAWVAIDWWQRQPQPRFTLEGIPLLGWYGLGVLALAGLMCWKARPRPAFSAALALGVGAAWLPFLFLSVAAAFLPPFWFWAAAAAVVVHLFVYLVRGLRAITGRPQLASAVLAVIFVVAFIRSSDALDAIPDLWNPQDQDAQEARPGQSDATTADRETALFEQAGRIDAALEHIRRDPSAGPAAFFLGFAGVGDEKVFAQEIELASRVLGERYRIGDRHLSLINDERHLDGAPLASVSGLDYTLQGLAARMDVSRDVLFLAISSHGSADPVIAVSNSRFPLVDLTPADLAEALHDSGIQWRVIIISACYAGGFIDALRDPKTIILTAAAADRTSFGCSNDRDLTYFGEAFYRDAVPHSPSLRGAFEAASKALAEREGREHVTPSEPQAYFGAAMEAKLATLEAKPSAVLAATIRLQ